MKELKERLKKSGIIIHEPQMLNLYSKALNIAGTDANVLIIGDSGTGKDCLAKFIHQNSPRSSKPFIHINCTSIPPDLFESELFGYEAGAFTGARYSGKKGLAEQAIGGTLFLDEIGELDLELQTKLLQLVQEHKFLSLGANEAKEIDIRIIAATNQDLTEMIHTGHFRLDLYYRLNVVNFHIPPLCQRPKDILALINSLSEKYGSIYHTQKKFTFKAQTYLLSQKWIGNVRELQNFMEKLYVLEDVDVITDDILKTRYHFMQTPPIQKNYLRDVKPLTEAVAQFEKQYITSILQRSASSSEAAKALGIDLPTLYKKINL